MAATTQPDIKDLDYKDLVDEQDIKSPDYPELIEIVRRQGRKIMGIHRQLWWIRKGVLILLLVLLYSLIW